MKLLFGLLVMGLLAANMMSSGGRSKADGSRSRPPGTVPGYVATVMREQAGIRQASDIESAVMTFLPRGTYKLTYEANPAFIVRLYDALRSSYYVGSPPEMLGSRLVLNLNDGKSVWLQFDELPWEDPQLVYIAPAYAARKLLPLFQETRTNARAATLDARIGDFEVRRMEVRTPHASYWARVPPSSDEGKALIEKSRQIVDWVDLRNTAAHRPLPGEIGGAQAKFGVVMLYLKTPIQVEVMVRDKATAPPGFPNPFAHSVSFPRFQCDVVKVLDYGNYVPPLVALRDKDKPAVYYLCTWLIRRQQEKYGVEKYGFPGHPITDTEYYKSPKILYKELQELTKVAYEKYAQ